MERLVEAIKEGEIVRVSEAQARREELFVLRSVPEIVKEETPAHSNTLDLTRHENQKSAGKYDLWKKAAYKRNNVLNELNQNFHWDILKKRRGLGLSRKQLADRIGESEERLKIVENGGLPDDNFAMIIKIEKALNVSLRKDKPSTGPALAELQKMDQDKIKEEIDKAHGLDRSRVREAIERVKERKEESGKEESIFGDDIEIID